MVLKMYIVFAALALLMPCCLSAPRLPRDTPTSCSDGPNSTLSCPPAVLPANPLIKGNQDLWHIMCNSRIVQQLAKGVCFNLSEGKDAKAECCADFPNSTDTESHTDSGIVFNLTSNAVVGRGVVQLGRQVCEAEKVKLLRGCNHSYEDCRTILQVAEELHLNVVKAVLSYRCGCERQLPEAPCHYNPAEVPETPSNITADLRGFAKWSTKFANSLLWTLYSNQISSTGRVSVDGCGKAQVVNTLGVCY